MMRAAKRDQDKDRVVPSPSIGHVASVYTHDRPPVPVAIPPTPVTWVRRVSIFSPMALKGGSTHSLESELGSCMGAFSGVGQQSGLATRLLYVHISDAGSNARDSVSPSESGIARGNTFVGRRFSRSASKDLSIAPPSDVPSSFQGDEDKCPASLRV